MTCAQNSKIAIISQFTIIILFIGPPRDGHRFSSVEQTSRGISSTGYGSVTKLGPSGSSDLGEMGVRWVPPIPGHKTGSVMTFDEYSEDEKNSIHIQFK